MPLELANTIWNELKRYIPQTDRSEAADAFVMAMIDDDIDADDFTVKVCTFCILHDDDGDLDDNDDNDDDEV